MQPTARTSRRALLLGLAALSLLRPGQGGAADPTRLTFDELYSAMTVLGMTMSEKVKALAGKQVTMRGFMAPPLKAEANFFVLTAIPMSICPFCDSDADWPADIVVIYLDSARTFEQANAQIEVTGTLQVGSWTDPETGFVSLLRIVDADFRGA